MTSYNNPAYSNALALLHSFTNDQWNEIQHDLKKQLKRKTTKSKSHFKQSTVSMERASFQLMPLVLNH